MPLDQLLSAVGQIATWGTILLVFLTLREMQKQRRASQKPELIIPNVSIYGYSRDERELFIASHWTNKELRDGKLDIGNSPKVTLYNIGFGAAKDIMIKWDFDIQNTLKTIKDYCYQNSIPIVVSIQNGFLNTEIKSGGSVININAYSNREHPYLMPASVTSQGLESNLPWHFLHLLAILIYLDVHQSTKESNQKANLSMQKFTSEIPSIYLELSYKDIAGGKYKKKFDVKFNLFMMRFPLKEVEILSKEPVTQGMFEFIERN